MPELAEVEHGRTLLEEVVVGHRIVRVDVAPDARVFREDEPAQVKRALIGRTAQAARRWGKYLWLELSGSGPHPVFHFGMSGAFRAPSADSVRLWSKRKGTTKHGMATEILEDPDRAGRRRRSGDDQRPPTRSNRPS